MTAKSNYTVIRSEGEKTVLSWTTRGWRVFPCAPKEKNPLIKGWPEKATTDLTTIERWFKEFPNANWGIATGKLSNLLVIDIDVRDGGYATWKSLVDQHPETQETFTVQTGSGGKHLYFLYPEDWEPHNTADKIAKGIDTRAEGGFVVVPPSKTDSQYFVRNDTAP